MSFSFLQVKHRTTGNFLYYTCLATNTVFTPQEVSFDLKKKKKERVVYFSILPAFLIFIFYNFYSYAQIYYYFILSPTKVTSLQLLQKAWQLCKKGKFKK